MLSKKNSVLILFVTLVAMASISFKKLKKADSYISFYYEHLNRFQYSQEELLGLIGKTDLHSPEQIKDVKRKLQTARNNLKAMDFWFRYMVPIAYKKINGPLPVEWETEVFEKFEKPYRREGAGLTLAALYLDEENVDKDSLAQLIKFSIKATEVFKEDSIVQEFKSYHNFYLCNRLFLLNLAAIYTTGFECPDTTQIVPELRFMLENVDEIYQSFNESFPETTLPEDYLILYRNAVAFTRAQSSDYSRFDHFSFIKDYISPLFLLNQQLINRYHVVTRSLVDYSLNKKEIGIFDKAVYNAQNAKGIFLRVTDEEALTELGKLGKLLFYDPILSGHNKRSCASCHKPTEFFTDTVNKTAIQFNGNDLLQRNTPSLINAPYNHLVMLDGKHISLQSQAKAVITNPIEMGGNEKDVMEKILSCSEYKNGFKALLKYTPQETEISLDHIVSAITFYYSGFSKYYSPFDQAMDENKNLDASTKQGFNLFMSKAGCATCHFVPQFNGIKPPYVSSEFEVLGVPDDTTFKQVSRDKGRYEVNPADETLYAFRTGSIRNAAYTAPYMHNAVFTDLNHLIDFYDAGGGVGKGLKINNQTLSPDSLKLTKDEKNNLIAFIRSLSENMKFDDPPQKLPESKIKALNNRKVGGEY